MSSQRSLNSAALHSRRPSRRQQGKPPEFDHAIGYVTKIKHRFGGDPTTYREFLEILHSYQKQKESIKDVLD